MKFCEPGYLVMIVLAILPGHDFLGGNLPHGKNGRKSRFCTVLFPRDLLLNEMRNYFRMFLRSESIKC